MYLRHNLQELAKKKGHPIVITSYVTDKNDVISLQSDSSPPKEIKSKKDWRLFQELTVQADVIITGTGYLNRFAELGEEAQNVLTQFDEGGEFQELGEWRLKNGYTNRYPDIAVVSRSLDFKIPQALIDSGRKVIIFTTYEMKDSEIARELGKPDNVTIFGAGENGVDGAKMIKQLGDESYQVIRMATGPRVLKILMDANVLDRLYITRVDRKITDDPSSAITVLKGRKVDELAGNGYKLSERYVQDEVVTEDGQSTSQEYLVYEKA
jgi:riboflavin biosynthesis pyrimidine reductase